LDEWEVSHIRAGLLTLAYWHVGGTSHLAAVFPAAPDEHNDAAAHDTPASPATNAPSSISPTSPFAKDLGVTSAVVEAEQRAPRKQPDWPPPPQSVAPSSDALATALSSIMQVCIEFNYVCRLFNIVIVFLITYRVYIQPMMFMHWQILCGY